MFVVYCSSYHILFYVVFPKGCALSGKVIIVSETLLLVLDLAPELAKLSIGVCFSMFFEVFSLLNKNCNREKNYHKRLNYFLVRILLNGNLHMQNSKIRKV